MSHLEATLIDSIHWKLKESDDVTNVDVYFNIYLRDM